MKVLQADPEIRERLDELRTDGVKTVPVQDVGDIVNGILDSLNGDVSSIDLTLFGELESLAVFIRAAKGDIASNPATEGAGAAPSKCQG